METQNRNLEKKLEIKLKKIVFMFEEGNLKFH